MPDQQNVAVTISNMMSDTMTANSDFDMKAVTPTAYYLGAGTADVPPEDIGSMSTESNNAGIYNATDGIVHGIFGYTLPDKTIAVWYLSNRGVGVGRVPNGTALNDELLKDASAYSQPYQGSLIHGRHNYLLSINASATPSGDGKTMNVKSTVNVIDVSRDAGDDE